jgi:hypothetical protein
MAYNLRRGHGVEDEEQPPPPPPPTPAELMQTVVEGQRMLADAMRQLANRRLVMVIRARNQINIVISRNFLTPSPRSLRRRRNLCKLTSG